MRRQDGRALIGSRAATSSAVSLRGESPGTDAVRLQVRFMTKFSNASRSVSAGSRSLRAAPDTGVTCNSAIDVACRADSEAIVNTASIGSCSERRPNRCTPAIGPSSA